MSVLLPVKLAIDLLPISERHVRRLTEKGRADFLERRPGRRPVINFARARSFFIEYRGIDILHQARAHLAPRLVDQIEAESEQK